MPAWWALKVPGALAISFVFHSGGLYSLARGGGCLWQIPTLMALLQTLNPAGEEESPLWVICPPPGFLGKALLDWKPFPLTSFGLNPLTPMYFLYDHTLGISLSGPWLIFDPGDIWVLVTLVGNRLWHCSYSAWSWPSWMKRLEICFPHDKPHLCWAVVVSRLGLARLDQDHCVWHLSVQHAQVILGRQDKGRIVNVAEPPLPVTFGGAIKQHHY